MPSATPGTRYSCILASATEATAAKRESERALADGVCPCVRPPVIQHAAATASASVLFIDARIIAGSDLAPSPDATIVASAELGEI